MTDWIGDVFTSDRGWALLERVVDVGDRMAGTEGERRAAGLVSEALADVGCRDVAVDEFGVARWRRGGSTVATSDGEEDCVALPRSPAGDVEGRLVDLGDGLPEDVASADLEGAIAMASSDTPGYEERFVHRREKYFLAADAGAVGFVFRNHVDGCLAPTGSVGGRDEPLGPIPAVGVSKEVGRRLSRRDGGEDDGVGIRVDAGIEQATSRNVRGGLGPDGGERVLVTCHVDAHDVGEGAVDNGAGLAAVAEIAGALATREDELERGVELLAFGSEEVGLVGSEHDASARPLDDVVAVVNVDGIARSRTLQVHTHGDEAIGALFRGVAADLGHPIEVVPRASPHSDHWPYVRRGVPGCHVKSATGSRDRGWGHTRADTLDKLERRTVREQAVLLTEAVVRAAGASFAPERRSVEEVERALVDQGFLEGMRVTGDWPPDGSS